MASLTKAHVVKMMRILDRDRRNMLVRLDAYNRGIQDDPWLPDNADNEYRLLAERSKTNIVPFIVSTPAQALYVDQYRRGTEASLSDAAVAPLRAKQPEWDHWEESNLQSRQHAVYRGALTFGHAFTATEFDKNGRLKTRGLSPLRTTALFDDPANDIVPVHAFTVVSWPTGEGDNRVAGKAIAWDETHRYPFTFKALSDDKGIVFDDPVPHKATENPVTRFTAFVDLEGRTSGVVEPMIDLQNRLNQTIFDMLVVQSYAAFKVRTVTGMAPPVVMEPIYEDGELTGWQPKVDEQGRMIPDQQNINARRWMWAEDKEVKFDTLDETPLDGFIAAIDLAFRHIAALGQIPPHHLLGQIANLSADALTAAETALERKVQEFKSSFGESWERVFRLAMEMLGEDTAADDFTGEILWRDMEQRSLSQAGDALGKMREQLGIPAKGLWSRVPGATAAEIRYWEKLADEDEPTARLANALGAADTTSATTQFREPANPEGEPA